MICGSILHVGYYQYCFNQNHLALMNLFVQLINQGAIKKPLNVMKHHELTNIFDKTTSFLDIKNRSNLRKNHLQILYRHMVAEF